MVGWLYEQVTWSKFNHPTSSPWIQCSFKSLIKPKADQFVSLKLHFLKLNLFGLVTVFKERALSLKTCSWIVSVKFKNAFNSIKRITAKCRINALITVCRSYCVPLPKLIWPPTFLVVFFEFKSLGSGIRESDSNFSGFWMPVKATAQKQLELFRSKHSGNNFVPPNYEADDLEVCFCY